MVDQICNTRNRVFLGIYLNICQKITPKNEVNHVQRISIYCLFRIDFGYQIRNQFRVIIPKSVTSLGGGEEPKNVPSNFGVLQFYIILALALLTILSENFGFFSQTATILRDAAKIKLLHYDGPENLFSLLDVENFERKISCFLLKKPGYILKLLINSFFDEERHFCKSTFSCQNFIVIVDL